MLEVLVQRRSVLPFAAGGVVDRETSGGSGVVREATFRVGEEKK